MIAIELANGKGSVTVDDDDAARVSAFTWSLGGGYVIRTDRSTGRQVTVRLHRWLLGLEPGDPRRGDHIDGDPLNCQRENLRILPPGANAQNRKVNRTSSTGRRGVYRRRDGRYPHRPWVAHVRIDGKQRTLGYFATEDEAADAAAAARAEHMPYAVVGR